MVQELARKTAKKMENQGVIASKTIPIYAYGLELLYSSLAGVVALIIISAILGKPFLWIPYLAGFVPLRLSGGGYHAKTHFHCFFTFSLLYSLVLVRDNVHSTDEGLAVPMSYKSNNYFIILTSGSTKQTVKRKPMQEKSL